VTAELLLSETRASLERERKEKDQFRVNFAAALADARSRAEADHTESQAHLKYAWEELDRLRRDLDAMRHGPNWCRSSSQKHNKYACCLGIDPTRSFRLY
jgi:hypothetical protein